MADYGQIEPDMHPGYGSEAKMAEQSPLRAALSQLDRTIGQLDQSLGQLLERVAPLRRPDEQMPSPDRNVEAVPRARSEVVQVLDDMNDRLRMAERRISEAHAGLEI